MFSQGGLSTIPLSQRVYRSKYYTSTQVGASFDNGVNRKVVYKEWTYDKMDKAMRGVTDDGMSIRRAAEEFNVPIDSIDSVRSLYYLWCYSWMVGKILFPPSRSVIEDYVITVTCQSKRAK